MSYNSLNDPFNPDISLTHEANCECHRCKSTSSVQIAEGDISGGRHQHRIGTAAPAASNAIDAPADDEAFASSEEMMDRAIESAVVRSVFGHNEISRRSFSAKAA